MQHRLSPVRARPAPVLLGQQVSEPEQVASAGRGAARSPDCDILRRLQAMENFRGGRASRSEGEGLEVVHPHVRSMSHALLISSLTNGTWIGS